MELSGSGEMMQDGHGMFHEINHPAIGVPPFMETLI